MPAFVAALLEGFLALFKTRIGFFIVTVLTWLGVSYGSTHLILEPTIGAIKGYATGVGGAGQYGHIALDWIGYLHFDRALTMVFSAYAAKYSIANAKVFLFKRGTAGGGS